MASRCEKPPRVLVTGLSGFTGHYIGSALRSAGIEVVDPKAVEPAFDLTCRTSVLRAIELAQSDYIVHLAAISFVDHEDAAEFYRTNTVGTTNLLECVETSGLPVRKIVVASSANIYGNSAAPLIHEEIEPGPVNHYACSKLAMEHMVRQWFPRLPIVITRPFNYTGQGQPANFLIPKVVSHFATRSPRIELGNLDVTRDFSDVRDVATVYVRLLLDPVVSEVVNICSGQGLSLRWIIDECIRLTGHRPEVVVNPAFVRTNEIKTLVGSPDKLTSLIGRHITTPLSDTLAWMLERDHS